MKFGIFGVGWSNCELVIHNRFGLIMSFDLEDVICNVSRIPIYQANDSYGVLSAIGRIDIKGPCVANYVSTCKFDFQVLT